MVSNMDKRSYYTFPSRLYNFQREMKRRAKNITRRNPSLCTQQKVIGIFSLSMLVNNKKVKYSGSSWLIILQPSSREEINYTFEMQKNNNK